MTMDSAAFGDEFLLNDTSMTKVTAGGQLIDFHYTSVTCSGFSIPAEKHHKYF